MNNTISKLTKYFLYSILVVLIGKIIFYIPIFYTINMDNFKEMIRLERVDIISFVVFFTLLLLCEKKKRDTYKFYTLFYICFHLLSVISFIIYQFIEFYIGRDKRFEYHFWNELFSHREEIMQLFLSRFLDVDIISVYIVSSFFILKKYATHKI